MVKALWVLFIAGQILNAGNMNYAQENGYYETNNLYGKHPSNQEIYVIKTMECITLYGVTKALPKYKKPILIGANAIVWGVIYYDKERAGVKLNFSW